MRRNTRLEGGNDAGRSQTNALRVDSLSRRSVLGLAGGAIASSVAVSGLSSATVRAAGDGVEEVLIDYDEYSDPADVYRVWTCTPRRASFTDEHAYSDGQALEIALSAGDSCGTNTHFDVENALGYQPTELYDSFMFRLSGDWTMAPDDQCKISRAALSFSAGDGHSGGGMPNGANGWSAGLVVANRGSAPSDEYNLASYVYHMDGGRDNSGPWETETVAPGQWYHIEQYVNVNTTGEDGSPNGDGEYHVWVDGEPAFSRTDYRWTTDTGRNAIEYCGPYTRYGGGETAPRDMRVYYDDHRMVVGTGLNVDRLRRAPNSE